MNEFLDIYRLYTKNFQLDLFEETWSKEDIDRLTRLLEKIGSKIENGVLVVNALKRDLDAFPDATLAVYPLMNIRDTVFEIESLLYSKDQEKKLDQLTEEKTREKKEQELELDRKENRKWIRILRDEIPIKKYGTINIYSTIKDYIWDRLPTDFKHADVMALFKEFYEEKLDRELKESSYGTYASSYIRFYKGQSPPIMSWEEYDYSKDINKYKIVDKEPEKKVTDSKQARETLLEKKEDDASPLTEETEKLLSEEHIEEKTGEILETTKPVKTGRGNPFDEGAAEHYLYQTAVETGWTGFKGTPLIMVKKRMSMFPKEEIKKAIDALVKKKKAKRLPNNFIAFSL